MLVNKNIYLLALYFLTSVDVIGTLWLSYVTTSGVESKAASIISFIFCWSLHLPTWWYIFLMSFIHLCSKEDLVNDYCSIPIVFILYSRRDDCNMHLITTHCFSNVSIYRMESMDLFNILDLTHWSAWGYLLLTWKHKYYLPTGVNYIFWVAQQVQ